MTTRCPSRCSIVAIALIASACGGSADVAPDATPPSPDAAPPEPITLATTEDLPTTITVDDTAVYWAIEPDLAGTTRWIWRTDKAGGSPRLLATAWACMSGFAIKRLVADDQHLYWTHCGVSRVDKVTGGDPEPSTGADSSTQLVDDGSNLYALTDDALVVGSKATFAFTERVGGLYQPNSLALAGSTLYFATLGDGAEGQIYTMPLSGSTPTSLAKASWTLHVAADASGVYWDQPNVISTDVDDAIMKWSTATQQVTTLVPHAVTAHNLTTDGTHLYWVEQWRPELKRIMRVPIEGGEPSLVFAEPGITGLAVDATHVYWTNRAEGTIRQMVKP